MRTYLTYPSLLVLALLGLASRSAHAQSTCSIDTDCVKGWTCQVTGGSSCGSPACAPGEKCEQLPSDCVSEEFKSCRPGACRADSDCAEDMVCHSHTESDCAPSACAAGEECPPPRCELKTESACVPRYVLPCTTASDCGAGFQCESGGEECACSGSDPGGSGASDGSEPPPTPSSCTCTTAASRCQAVAVSCEQNSDCSGGWTCAVVASASDCASTAGPSPTPGSGARDGGGGALPPDCRPSADIKQCVPPYYGLVDGFKGVDLDSSDGPNAGGGDATAGNADDAYTPENGTADPTSSAGCSVGHGSRAGSTLAVLGALGLFSALRRRRAR
ncbi:MAG TPA: MYXO-CTERM sorting domain-containing protein [Polyangiaceae bacterium]|nr:MYXO-CTERM sorting domain-containing protein [Polyangiaceae bacterium]